MVPMGLALALGFLHGLGADHLMAIAALSIGAPVAASRARTLRIAVGFACGHAALIAVATALAIGGGWTIPLLVERSGEVVGGCLLIVLGASGLWLAATGRLHRHTHVHDVPGALSPPHTHWHVHAGANRAGVGTHRHTHLPAILGAVFAVSGIRALALLTPINGGHGQPLLVLLALVLAFAIGIVLSMSLFGIVLARTLGTPRLAAWAGQAAAVVIASGSLVLGAYWVLWRP
jgi:hypothetical protein